MFTIAVFTMARPWKQPKCLSTNELLKKILYINTVEYYFCLKDKIFSFGRTQMHLEGIRLREISHSETNKYPKISLLCVIFKSLRTNTIRRVTHPVDKLVITRVSDYQSEFWGVDNIGQLD